MKKEEFDSVIKNNLIEVNGRTAFGYELSKTYENYYSKSVFKSFLEEMQQPCYMDSFERYENGKGSELKEQHGRYGKTPPKMASVASSSRFCYLALRDGAQCLGSKEPVQFEHECRIKGISGTAPQLDGYIPDGNIYFEAKCHEIFDNHKIKMKAQYWDYLYGHNNEFGFAPIEKTDGVEFEIPLSVFGINKEYSMFDIKQFLCHLLGIVSNKEKEESATLVYMFFKPLTDSALIQRQIEEVFKRLEDEIENLFDSSPIREFIKCNNIKIVAIAEFAKIMEPLRTQNMIIMARTEDQK